MAKITFSLCCARWPLQRHVSFSASSCLVQSPLSPQVRGAKWKPPSSYIDHEISGSGVSHSSCTRPSTATGVRGPTKLGAFQHVHGGSVERNDAAATGPLVKPDAKLTAEESVKAQMDSLAHNDFPRPDHGLEVMYYFANAEGALNGSTMSQYFGFASDLYHFGHFAIKFKTRYPELIGHSGYEIINVDESGELHCEIKLKLKQVQEGCHQSWIICLSKSQRAIKRTHLEEINRAVERPSRQLLKQSQLSYESTAAM